jgi:histidine triad (HIT) family protein
LELPYFAFNISEIQDALNAIIHMNKENKEDCAFCKIIHGEVKSSVVFEDAVSLAFLDQRPLFPGHCLLVPKEHYPTLADLPHQLITPLFTTAQLISQAVELAMEAEGSFVAINNRISQSVPHLHIHIVPRRKKDGLKGFFWPRQPYQDEESMRNVARLLRETIENLHSKLQI